VSSGWAHRCRITDDPWLLFLAVVVLLLAFDLGVLHRDDHVIGVAESLKLSALYLTAGLTFGLWVWHGFGSEKALQFYTGFLIEKSLSLDNIFVISLIFSTLAIPPLYQHRVLFWGILGVILTRGIMIGAGSALVASYYWVLYIFGAILVVTGIKMLFVSENPNGVRDSALLAWLRRHLPAIFAITSDPFIVYTSNIFAVLGLRALYFALADVVQRFRYLKYSLAAVLVFIGSKIFLGDFVFGGKVPASLSLAVTVVLIGAGIAYSLRRSKRETTAHG